MISDPEKNFSHQHKGAVYVVLKRIGLAVSKHTGSKDLSAKCSRILRHNYKLLNFNATADHWVQRFDDDKNEDQLSASLATLATIVKPWFVQETNRMASAEGAAPTEAMRLALHYCGKAGISKEMYAEYLHFPTGARNEEEMPGDE